MPLILDLDPRQYFLLCDSALIKVLGGSAVQADAVAAAIESGLDAGVFTPAQRQRLLETMRDDLRWASGPRDAVDRLNVLYERLDAAVVADVEASVG